jgi:hypothetical protein
VIKLSERQQFFVDSFLLCYYHTCRSSFPLMLYNMTYLKLSVAASNVRSDGTAGNRACGDFTERSSYKNNFG